jgi:hypothetical protein
MLEDLVELLERQWRFLHAQEGIAFYRQLPLFMRFIQEDPRLAVLIDDMRQDGISLLRRHSQHEGLVLILSTLRGAARGRHGRPL